MLYDKMGELMGTFVAENTQQQHLLVNLNIHLWQMKHMFVH